MTEELKPKYVSNILCPHCKKKFEVGRIQGGWMGRTCPECGGSLLTREFDHAAAKTIQKQQAHKARELEEKDLGTRHQKIAKLIQNPLLAPLCFLLRRNAARHMKASDKARDLKVAATSELDQLAQSRYYASEWYLSTNLALKRVDNILGSFELSAKYGKGARTHLKQIKGDAVAGGVIGEWCVFDTLLNRIQEGEDLKDAKLIPNVFLPSTDDLTEGLRDQTDLLVLTRKAAFVCEVKNWRSHIRAQRDQEDLVIKSYEDMEKRKQGGHESGKPVSQIRQRMADLAAVGAYPKERIYGIAVFVDPTTFESTVKGFFNKAVVASCASDGSGTLIPIIEDKLKYKDDVLAQAEVDALAEMMLGSWVDRDGKLEREQHKLRDDTYSAVRHERLTALADLACARRQAGYERREEHGKKRDAAKASKKEAKSKDAKRQRHARKQRIYEIEQEYDEWDYLAC